MVRPDCTHPFGKPRHGIHSAGKHPPGIGNNARSLEPQFQVRAQRQVQQRNVGPAVERGGAATGVRKPLVLHQTPRDGKRPNRRQLAEPVVEHERFGPWGTAPSADRREMCVETAGP